MTIAGFEVGEARKAHGSRRLGAVFAFVAGALMMALGAGVVAHLPWQAVGEHLEARSWPVTQASIRTVSLLQDEGGLTLAVSYQFEANGETHEGHRASFEDRATLHDRRLKTLYSRLNFALLTGRTVPVLYDPQEPANAVFDVGFNWQRIVPRACVGFATLLLGLRLVLSRPRRAG